MTINKKVIIPLLFLLFAAFGLEEIAGEFIKFGQGRWTDSTGWNVSNRKSKINGDLDVMGSVLQNGSPIAGAVSYDTIVTKKDTARFFHKVDTTRLAGLKRANTFTGTNDFNAMTSIADVDITGALQIVGGSATIGVLPNFQSGIQLSDATKVIINSGSNILYQVTTGGSHIFETASGTDIIDADTAATTFSSVTNTFSGNVNVTGFSQFGNSPGIKFKIVGGVMPNTAAAMNSYAHGISYGNSKIVGWTVTARSDSTGAIATITGANDMFVYPGYSQITQLNYSATVDSLYCNVRTLGATNTASLFGDSVRFVLIYVE